MSGLRVLVVDDESLARDDLGWLLSQCSDVVDVLTADSGPAALSLLADRDDIDAVLLDIEMPGLSGVDLVRVLRNFKTPPQIAFVTAYDDYALDAFDLDVCDYLKKPVLQERLEETLRRFQARLDARDRGTVPASDASDGDEPGTTAHLVGRLGNDSFSIARSEVNVVEASGDYVRVFTADNSYLVRESISSLTSGWSAAGFVRIHRSFLVRGAAIKTVRNVDGRRSVVIDEREYPVSRRYARLLQEHLGARV